MAIKIINQTTHVHYVQDGSGSMSSAQSNTIKAFNEYIDKLKGDDNSYLLSLMAFATAKGYQNNPSDPFDWFCESTPIKDVQHITNAFYRTHGNTPLFDAIWAEIDHAETDCGQDPVLFIIMTDGYENASSHTEQQLKDRIEQKQVLGWVFLYLAPDGVALKSAAAIGIDLSNVGNLSNPQIQNASYMGNVAASTSMYASSNGRKKSGLWNNGSH